MGRGVSSGGGQSSLDYLFGSGEPKPTTGRTEVAAAAPPPTKPAASEPPPKPTAIVPQPDATKQIPAGIQGTQTNNYFRAEGQNTGNFLTVCSIVVSLRLYVVSVLVMVLMLYTGDCYAYRIDLRPRFMRHQVVARLWVTCLVMVASDNTMYANCQQVMFDVNVDPSNGLNKFYFPFLGTC